MLLASERGMKKYGDATGADEENSNCWASLYYILTAEEQLTEGSLHLT